MDVDIKSATAVNRAELLIKHVFRLSLQQFKTSGEEQAVHEFLRRTADISSFLMEHKQDSVALANLEKDILRPLAIETRAYTLREHLTCCSPSWASKMTTQPNRFAAFGSTELQASVAALAEPLGLRMGNGGYVGPPDSVRWDAIRGSNFGLFDFRRESRAEGKWASIGHALGLALSAGTLPVILSDGETKLLFDVNISPVEVKSVKQFEHIVCDAMAMAAVAQFDIQSKGSSLVDTIDYVLNQIDNKLPAARYLRPQIETLRSAVPPDPVTSRLYLKTLLDLTGNSGRVFLTPLWPGAYPKGNQRRCFHVLPFALPNAVSLAVEAGCRLAAVYERGDATGDIDVIGGIWRGIAQASHVVVDLTPADVNGSPADAQPNPNVCLELAMAQALGRKLLLVRDAKAKAAPLFPEIAKLQVLPYESTSVVTRYVESFVNET